MIGQTLSHYRILSRLGSGGMGVVYEAEDVRLGRRVAVKVLPAEACCDAEAMERFTREARIVSSLNHPHICMLFDVGQHDGGQFMVMEKLEGELLRSALARGPLPLDQILELGCHAASALSAAHARGVIHRDIKPANLFVTPHGLKVLDFGVAKLMQAGRRDTDETGAGTDELTRAGTALGTVAYMSPEQARGQEVDARSDLFSLGCVLYEMATGAPPFTGPTTAVVFEGLLTRTPAAPSSAVSTLPEAFDRIVLRALQKDPAARYATAAELQADLQRLQRQLDSGAMRGAATNTASASPPPAPGPAPVAAMPATAPPGTPTGGPMPVVAQHRGRTARRALFVGAPLALAAGIAAFVLLQSKGTPALSERDPVVLAQFVNRTGDAMFDDTLSEALALQLRQSPFLNVLSEQQVQATLRMMGRDPGEALTPEVGRELCQRAGAKAMLGGTIASLGRSYVVALAAQDCVTGETLAEQQAEAGSKEEVLKALGSAVGPFRTQLGESLASVQRYDARIEEATTPSLEALKAYSQGIATRRTEGDRAALPFFRRAIELDADFALAHARLGTIYANINEPEPARVHTTRAYELREGVSERERLYIEARYHTAVTKDVGKAIESYRLAVASFPTDYASRVNLAGLLKNRGEPEPAVPLLEEARKIAPGEPLAAVNLAGALLDLRRTDEALAAAREAVRLRDDGGSRNILLAAAIQQGDAATEQEQRAWAEGRPTDPDAVALLATSDAYHGRLASSTAEWIRLSALAGQLSLRDLALQARLAGGVFLAQAGDVKGARALVSPLGPPPRALSQNVASTWLTYAWLVEDAGLVEALAPSAGTATGEAAGPGSLDARANRTVVLAAQGRLPAALAELGEVPLARSSGNAVYLLGVLSLQAGRHEEAVRALGWVRDNPNPTDISPTQGVVRYWLALAYDAAKRPAEARAAYQAFLDFWKDADPTLPIVQEARKRLAQLGT